MFRQRTSSQKPADDLLANFRQQFPEVSVTSAATTAPAVAQTTAAGAISNPLINVSSQDSSAIDDGTYQDQDPTPRASNEPWRFTPSLMDPNTFSFAGFGNAPSGYYTPTPGGSNTLFHHQAGDLHTPLQIGAPGGLGTPLSMPTSGDVIHPGTTMMDVGGFQALPPHQLHHFNPFIQAPPPPQQQTFAPSSFVHHDTGYETMEQDGSPLGSDPSNKERLTSVDSAFHSVTPMVGFQPAQFHGSHLAAVLPPHAEKFRFHSTLNAPTAMIKQADEIPVTYLNKGQAYSLSIVDTHATLPLQPGTRFRTFVRVSFEDDEQRQKPGVCWSLWKEGRGTNEAHQRGGKLQAVEYVEAGQPAEGDEKRTRVELESSSFDGFSVIWTPGSQGAPEVNVAVRFNFLSTDFSHSKGVKGIPVRLCAKTSVLPTDPSQAAAPDTEPDICYCKVKLFRDHGAERKLSNDVAHVKKSIDKTKHQINQAESGLKDFGKRKRGGGKPKGGDPLKAGKVQKHKRTWSMSSASSADGNTAAGRTTLEDDLHYKLQTLQDMFTSTRPVSVLYLRGADLDDPDAHPVVLPGDGQTQVKAEAAREGTNWQVRSDPGSNADSIVSPSPSSQSLASQVSAIAPGGQWQNFDAIATGGDKPNKGPEQPTRVNKRDAEGNLSGWIEALGVDPAYRPPPEIKPKPAACFYVLRQQKEPSLGRQYYKAIYLMQRDLKEFNRRLCAKYGLDSSLIQRTIHTTQNGLEVEMDDDVIQELKEGQDMTFEIDTLEHQQAVKEEWEMSIDSSGSANIPASQSAKRFNIRLTF